MKKSELQVVVEYYESLILRIHDTVKSYKGGFFYDSLL